MMVKCGEVEIVGEDDKAAEVPEKLDVVGHGYIYASKAQCLCTV